MAGEAGAWFDRELAGCRLADERLNKRIRKPVAQIGSAMGESISAGLPGLGQHQDCPLFFFTHMRGTAIASTRPRAYAFRPSSISRLYY